VAKTYTGTPMAPDHALGGIYAIMDRNGMLPDEIFCARCAKPLNADGNHPAELYAGTYNGLCYGCTSAGPFVAAVAQLDGCQRVSWPPKEPSYRRSREDHYGYPDCGNCQGLGATGSPYYAKTCDACLARWQAHPVTVAQRRWSELMHRSLQATFDRAIDRAAGIAPKCPRKKREALREVFFGDAGEKDRDFTGPMTRASTEYIAFREPYRAAGKRVRELVLGEFRKMGWGVWTETERDPEQFWRSYCKWRRLDPDTGLGYGYPDGFRYPHQPKPLCTRHRMWDGCKECLVRVLMGQTLARVEDWYRMGHFGLPALAAYRHVWATSAYRYSAAAKEWEDPPEDPETIELVALMRRAAQLRKEAS